MGRSNKATSSSSVQPEPIAVLLWAAAFVLLAVVPDQKILRYKLLGAEGATAALLALVFIRWFMSAPGMFRKTPLDAPVALYGLSALLFYAVSPERAASSLELTRMLFCTAAFFAASQTLNSASTIKTALWAWAASAGALSLYALLQLNGGIGPVAVPLMERPIATFGNPIFLAAYLSASACVSAGLAWASTGKARNIAAGLAVLCLAGMTATHSRASVAGLAVAAFAVSMMGLKGKQRWTALGVLLVGVLGAAWLFKDRQWTHGLIWRDSLALWLSNPFFGCGLGRFHIEFPGFASEATRALWPQDKVIINFAHNEYLQVLAETGALGLGVFLSVPAVLAAWAKRNWALLSDSDEKKLSAGLALAAVALFAQNVFSPDLRYGLSSFVLFVCLGAAVSLTAGRDTELPVFPGRLGLGVVGVISLFLWGGLALKPLFAQRGMAAQPEFHTAGDASMEEAIAKLEAALVAEPGNADIAENLAYLYAKKKDWAKAVSRFEIASGLAPSRPGPLNNIGNIYYSIGDRENAIAFWKRAVAVAPDQLDAHINLGKALYEVGRLKEASAHLQEVLKRDPKNEKAQILQKKMFE